MKYRVLSLLACSFASAHNLDEYLQAALIEVSVERVDIYLRLTPGPAVFSAFSALVDRNRDGAITKEEARLYVREAAMDWRLSLDGSPLSLRCEARNVADGTDLREGVGGVEAHCSAEIPGAFRGLHQLRFHNAHQRTWSSYLMNALQPEKGITIRAQRRDLQQREITIEYEGPAGAKRAGTWMWGLWVAPLALRMAALAWAETRKVGKGSAPTA